MASLIGPPMVCTRCTYLLDCR